jgi:hypothetical protein
MFRSKMVAQEATTPQQVEECSARTSCMTDDDSLRSCPPLNKKASSSVSFNSAQDEIHEIPSARTLSKREKLERWRSDDEFAACIDACKRELYKLYAEPYDVLRFRGLELVDPDICNARQRRYMQEVRTVKKEQLYQRQQGIYDDEGIQKAYSQGFAQQIKRALDNARVDNIAVREYLEDTMLELEAEYKAQKEKEAKKGSGVFNSLRRSFSIRRSFSNMTPSKKARPTQMLATSA